jgi:hypothetical protein
MQQLSELFNINHFIVVQVRLGRVHQPTNPSAPQCMHVFTIVAFFSNMCYTSLSPLKCPIPPSLPPSCGYIYPGEPALLHAVLHESGGHRLEQPHLHRSSGLPALPHLAVQGLDQERCQAVRVPLEGAHLEHAPRVVSDAHSGEKWPSAVIKNNVLHCSMPSSRLLLLCCVDDFL